MKIKWLGHSCFLLTSNRGIKILTDPFDEKVGYSAPSVEADIVTVSHGHYDHSNTNAVKGSFEIINKSGSYLSKGVEIKGVQTFHDEQKGQKRGGNIVFRLGIDGVRLCHCGDLGHVLTEEQAKEIGKIDVLLVPVGGTYTIDADGAIKVMKLLKPAITIPMHFKTEALTFSLDGANKFLADAGGGEMIGKQEIEINSANIDELSSIIVLNYK